MTVYTTVLLQYIQYVKRLVLEASEFVINVVQNISSCFR